MAEERERLRLTFGQVAELYDRVRPTYPPAVLDDLAALGGIPDGGRLVEIGPGTGKATVALAERGYAVVAVELAPELAAVARRNLARFSRAEVVTADFERWEPERAGFDAVVAFTAFHWLSPEVRYAKPARLLRPGGALGVVSVEHVLPADGDSFFAEVQEDYDAVVPHPDNRPPPPPEEKHGLGGELVASGLFADVAERRHVWPVEYTADEYLDVLGTYSGNLALPRAQRDELFRRIRRRVEGRPGGGVTKHYVAVLTVGRTITAE